MTLRFILVEFVKTVCNSATIVVLENDTINHAQTLILAVIIILIKNT